MVELDGDPWFLAADVCRILGIYQNSNDMAGRVKSRLGVEEWQMGTVLTPHPRWAGKEQRPTVLLVSESGLYKLIMRSDKPEARAFGASSPISIGGARPPP
ncbi:MAG: Bro-N domain-containing protein [Erythrobacter cryptus]